MTEPPRFRYVYVYVGESSMSAFGQLLEWTWEWEKEIYLVQKLTLCEWTITMRNFKYLHVGQSVLFLLLSYFQDHWNYKIHIIAGEDIGCL